MADFPTNHAGARFCPCCGRTWHDVDSLLGWTGRYEHPQVVYHVQTGEADFVPFGEADPQPADSCGYETRRFLAGCRPMHRTLLGNIMAQADSRDPVGVLRDPVDARGFQKSLESTRCVSPQNPQGKPRDIFVFRFTLEGERWRVKDEETYCHAQQGALYNFAFGAMPYITLRDLMATASQKLPEMLQGLGLGVDEKAMCLLEGGHGG